MAAYNVMVPLDGSRLAEHPLVYLNALKRLGDVSVTLLSAVDVSEHYPGLDDIESRQRSANLLSTYLREVSHDIHEFVGLEVETKLVTGVPAYCLADEIALSQPDLLLLATHGRTGLSRWRFGGVADKLIRSSECNTLIIGPKATEHERWLDANLEEPFQSILVPLDGSVLASQAFAVAGRIAEVFGSDLHLLSAVGVADGSSTMAMQGSYAPPLLEERINSAREYLAQSAGSLASDQQVSTEVRIGDAAAEIEGYTKQHDIDLVVMTSHGRGGMVRTALGSVADRVLSTAMAPVLLVHPRAD